MYTIDNGVPLVQYLVILDDFGEDRTFHGHGGNDVKHFVEHRKALDRWTTGGVIVQAL